MKTLKRFLGYLCLAVLYQTVFSKILREECLRDGKFDKVTQNTYLPRSSLLHTLGIENHHLCIAACMHTASCKSLSYHEKKKNCLLFKHDLDDAGIERQTANGFTHFQTDLTNKQIGPVCESLNPCPGHYCEDICTEPGYLCTCAKGFVGNGCDKFTGNGSTTTLSSTSCDDIRNNYPTVKAGLYWIDSFETYCQMNGNELPNVALNKPATQSTRYQSYFARNAFDGNRQQSKVCSHTADTVTQNIKPWLQVDLQERYSVSYIRIFNRNDKDYFDNRFKNVKLVISDSGDATVNRKICAAFVAMPDPVTDIATFFCPKSCDGRYVRVEMDNEFKPLHLCEVEVMGVKV